MHPSMDTHSVLHVVVWTMLRRRLLSFRRQRSGASPCSTSSATSWTSDKRHSPAAACIGNHTTYAPAERIAIPCSHEISCTAPPCSGLGTCEADGSLEGWMLKLEPSQWVARRRLMRVHAVACISSAGPVLPVMSPMLASLHSSWVAAQDCTACTHLSQGDPLLDLRHVILLTTAACWDRFRVGSSRSHCSGGPGMPAGK